MGRRRTQGSGSGGEGGRSAAPGGGTRCPGQAQGPAAGRAHPAAGGGEGGAAGCPAAAGAGAAGGSPPAQPQAVDRVRLAPVPPEGVQRLVPVAGHCIACQCARIFRASSSGVPTASTCPASRRLTSGRYATGPGRSRHHCGYLRPAHADGGRTRPPPPWRTPCPAGPSPAPARSSAGSPRLAR